MSKWMPKYREQYESVIVDDKGARKITPFNDANSDERHLLDGNCFPLGTINEAHLHELNELIRSFGNAETGE